MNEKTQSSAPTEQDVLSLFGITPEEEQEETKAPETEEAETEKGEAEETPPQAEESNESETETEDSEEEVDPSKFKAQNAFAKMRVQNKQYEDALKAVGKILGLEGKGTDELLAGIQEAALKGEAKKTNVPETVLKELTELRNKVNHSEAQQIEQAAIVGFQKVKDNFSLSQKDLVNFANSLQQDGVNPFSQHIDLEKEYISRNYKALLAKAKEEGMKAEAERSTKAQTKSTTPNNKTGGPKPEESEFKITSVKDLEKYVNENFKK